MLDAHIGDGDFDDVEPIGDAGNPFVAAQSGKPERDSFVQCSCRYLDGVRNAVQVFDRDAA